MTTKATDLDAMALALASAKKLSCYNKLHGNSGLMIRDGPCPDCDGIFRFIYVLGDEVRVECGHCDIMKGQRRG